MFIKRLVAAVAFGALSVTAAQAVTYEFDFVGSGGYSMTGLLSFDDSLQNTGVIDETQIDDLSLEVFRNGTSLGARSLSIDGLDSTASFFNVNFDTVGGQFVVGGLSFSTSGQNFFSNAGNGCDTVGFSSGRNSQGVCVNGTFVGAVSISSPTLTARLVDPAPVPLPAAGFLLLAGLGGIMAVGRRKTA